MPDIPLPRGPHVRETSVPHRGDRSLESELTLQPWVAANRCFLYPSRPPRVFGGGTSKRACSSIGRALPWHGRGRRFEPDQVHFANPLRLSAIAEVTGDFAFQPSEAQLGRMTHLNAIDR